MREFAGHGLRSVVSWLNAKSLKLLKEVFMALSASGECPCQSVISPVTRSGSRDRYDFVGLPRNFLVVRSGSSSIGPVGFTT
jgi:hypothetical protein